MNAHRRKTPIAGLCTGLLMTLWLAQAATAAVPLGPKAPAHAAERPPAEVRSAGSAVSGACNSLVATTILVMLNLAGLLTWRNRLLGARQLLREQVRNAERSRIARELHDNLLQVFQGQLLRLQAVRNLLPGRTEEAMPLLDDALERGIQALIDTRDAVIGLRSQPTVGVDIVQALYAERRELQPQQGPPRLRVVESGSSRRLAPSIGHEVYFIAREALRNACQHAGASAVDIELVYDTTRFMLRVHDDGVGWLHGVGDPRSKPGHFGLQGAHERARDAGGRIRLSSAAGTGTTLTLTIPGRIAYRRPTDRSGAGPLTRKVEV